MYPHLDSGYRQTPGLVEFASYSGPSTNNDYTTVIDTQITNPLSFDYNYDGTKLFVLDSTGVIYQYACTVAFGPPTSYSTKSLDVTTLDSSPVAIQWRSDLSTDNVFYLLGATGSVIKTLTASGSDPDIDEFADAGLDITPGSITGTFDDFYGDGSNWIIQTTTGTFHYTCSNWESSFTYQTNTSTKLNSFTESGKAFVSTVTSTYWRTATAFDFTTLYQVDSLSNLQSGLPAGVDTHVTTRTYDGNYCTVAQVNGANYYASWSTTDLQMVSGGDFRGGEVMGGIPYIVLGKSLLSFDASGVFTSYQGDQNGPSGTDDVIIDTDGTNLVIVSDNQYRYSVAGGWETISDSDIANTVSVAYLDSTFYYPVGGNIFASDLGDPTTVGSTNFINAESFTDDITRNLTLNQLHFSFGSKTTEIHFTSGEGNTRLSRQAVLEHGIVGKFAVDSIDDNIYFVDAERRLSVMRGLQYTPINIPGLGKEFDSYITVDDCIVSTYTFEQQNFIEVTFPTQDVTWTVHEASGEIFKREDTSGDKARSAEYLKAYGKTYAADHSNGKIYVLSGSNYQEDGNTMARTLFSEVVTSETFELSAREFSIDAIYIGYDTTGSSNITITVSNDSGATFDNSQTITVNGRGIYRLAPLWGQAIEFIIKITTSANQKVDILNLAVEMEAAND